MNDVVTQIIIAVGSALVSMCVVVMRQSQVKAKELADAVLEQNKNHHELDKRVAVLESKKKL